MAELMVGLSKTVVEGALAKVQSAIEEDAKLRQKAQRNLVVISLEFEMMQSFLNVAREDILTKNNLVSTWVRHVRELAYDLEDCVEFVVHLDDKPIFWRRLLPSCMVSPLPLDQAVREIEDIKGRAEELSKCYLRYSNITVESAGSKVVMMQQQASSWAAAITSSSMLAEARDAARGRQGLGDLAQLIDKKDHQLQVISVWGTGGDHGMIPIIRKAYYDPEICKNFACRAWVKLMHPFNPNEFVQRFMAQVYANACQEEKADVGVGGVHVLMKMKGKQEHLLEEFVQEVKSKTWLVILDNLTDMADWDAVRTFLPDMKNGSLIIVSTQHVEIASLSVGRSYQILELKRFTADHSICAFFKEAFHFDRGDEWMVDRSLVGRESEMNELRSYTAGERFRSSPVISVWGMPGIGKSALISNLYVDIMLHSKQFHKYSWVDVSHPLNLRDFWRSILVDFHSEKDPVEECCELLRQYQCLIVIDSLQSKQEWDLIRSALLSRPSQSVIIVITTEPSIATYCTNKEQIYNVRGLEADAALDLFRKKVHRNNPSSHLNDYCSLEIEELILKCGGIPQVVVSIATLLATKTITLMDTVRSLNAKFMHHLESDLECNTLRVLFGWMNSYFHASPDFLKPCIFYLSIFPRDQIIRRRRLVRRWIAEGYSRDNDDKSAEERAENLFSQLIDLNIIEQPPQITTTTATGNKRMPSYQVNGFIREYIVSQQAEENLVLELGSSCVLTSQRTGRHLVILKSWERDIIVYKSIDFSRLRSLTIFGKWEPFFISKGIKTLRVLDLEDASGITDGDLEKMVNLLHRLKFLSLRGHREICHLPGSLGDLRQLQTLDVRGTSIGSLPKSITKLQKLQYVRAGTNDVPTLIVQASSSSWLPEFRKHSLLGVQVPSGIGILRGLHTLGVVNVVASGGKTMVEEIKKLTQLRKLGVSGINKHNRGVFFSAISNHVHLESLLVRLDKDNQCYLDDISLPENLQSLKLYGLQDKLPLSRSHLRTLMKLTLEMDTLKKNDIEFLSKLPELSILRLRVKQQLQDGQLHFYAKMPGELSSFEKLKILEIACSSSELQVTFGSKSMNNLELLKLDYSSASYQLAGLNSLSELKQVLLKGTDDEAFRAEFASHLANHPNRPVVKLEELPRPS